MTGSWAGSTSRSLLERVRADDAEAWDHLVRLYSPFVWQCCTRARLPKDDAADVFQEVFQAAAKKIGAFEKRAEAGSFRGWLRTIARNKVHDHFRRLQKEPRAVGGTDLQLRMNQVPARDEPDPLASGETPTVADDEADRWLYRDALELIRENFQERTWQAFWRTTVDGRSAADVGEELEMSQGAVRVAKSRVLARLRAELGDLIL